MSKELKEIYNKVSELEEKFKKLEGLVIFAFRNLKEYLEDRLGKFGAETTTRTNQPPPQQPPQQPPPQQPPPQQGPTTSPQTGPTTRRMI